jgi:hypothetical protein
VPLHYISKKEVYFKDEENKDEKIKRKDEEIKRNDEEIK